MFCLTLAVVEAEVEAVTILPYFLLETTINGLIFSFEAMFKDFLGDELAAKGGGRGAAGIFDFDLSCLHFLDLSEPDESSSDENGFISRFLLMPLPI